MTIYTLIYKLKADTQTFRTDNDFFLLLAALGTAEPLQGRLHIMYEGTDGGTQSQFPVKF